MAIEQVALELIDDNPFNPRKYYNQNKVREMANSLREVGLREIPEGRRIDGRVQLAYGHVRKQAFLLNQKKDPEKWKSMPIDIKDISDENMFHWAWEENVRRTDISQIELARCIQAFNEMFPDMKDEELGRLHSMSAETVSNMRRVLRLPDRFLEKIDAGTLSFSQGKELLVLEGLPNAEEFMSEALRGLKTGGRAFGEPDTVDGLIRSIHGVIHNHFPPLDKTSYNYRYDLVFDPQAAGCLKCPKTITTHPSKKETALSCLDNECWQKKQEEHREKAAAAAKAKVEAEVMERAREAVIETEKELAAPPEPEPVATPVMINENTILVDQETFDKLAESNSCDRISEGKPVRKPVEFEGKLYLSTGSSNDEVEAYVLVSRAEFQGEIRTYSVPKGRDYEEYFDSLRADPNGFYHGMLVKRGKEDCVLVGPEVSFVTKVDKDDFPHGKSTEAPPMSDEEFAAKANGRPWPPEAAEETPPAPIKEPAAEIPEDIMAKAREVAGTRAEVLDMNEISSGNTWSRQMKQGYVLLTEELRHLDDPDECTERCTHGFHFAFDSKARDQKVFYICTDPKCLSKKKGDLTRKKNAEGHARKNAEKEAINRVLEQVGQVVTLAEEHIHGIMTVAGIKAPVLAIPRRVLDLIIYNQLHGSQLRDYYYDSGVKSPSKWLWDKLSAGTHQDKSTEEALWKLLDALSDAELVKLVILMMFVYLMDTGDVSNYEIKTVQSLALFGVAVNGAVKKSKNQKSEA
jgi:ParB/RepB/Spo0J family partition protein